MKCWTPECVNDVAAAAYDEDMMFLAVCRSCAMIAVKFGPVKWLKRGSV